MNSSPASMPAPAPALRAIVVHDPELLAPYLDAWDDLAIETGRPYCSPFWMLAWWREAREGDARLRVVVVLDGQELVGVGPFFAQIGPLGLTEIRLLAAGFCHRIGPLARPGEERSVARVLAAELAQTKPSPASVVFEGLDTTDPWPQLLAEAWPSRRKPRERVDMRMDGRLVQLDADYEAWLGRRERRFRKEARRTARRLQEAAVEGRFDCREDDLTDLMRLHHERWRDRGGSALGAEAQRVIVRAAADLAPTGRLRVSVLEAPSGPVAAELVLLAGGTAAFWGGGFAGDWAKHAPGTQAMLHALEGLAGMGVRVADLGGGADEYKIRLADLNQPLVWRTLFPPGWRYPLIRARLAPKHARLALRGAFRRLPARHRRTLLRLARRGRS